MGNKLRFLLLLIPSLLSAYLALAYLYSYSVLLRPREIYLYGEISERSTLFLIGVALILFLQAVYVVLLIRYFKKSAEMVNVLIAINFILTVGLLYWVISNYSAIVIWITKELWVSAPLGKV